MKRSLFALCLLLCLLLSGCGKERFLLSEDGYALTDTKRDVRYVVLDPAFQPARGGEEVGNYVAFADTTYTLREIPELDPALWLADDHLNVFYAGDQMPDPSKWLVSAVLYCEEDEISVEQARLTAAEHAEVIASLCALYFKGEQAELPPEELTLIRAVKLVPVEPKNIYYCFDYRRFADGSAYFTEQFSGRVVAIPAELDARLGVM